MSWASDFHFTVEPSSPAPKSGWGDTISPWAASGIAAKTAELQPYQTDEKLKKLYGIELAKTANPFEAGCKIFGEDTNKALWISYHWLADAIVQASRDAYAKTLELSQAPLDREQLAAKLLALADENILKDGRKIPTIEAKDRIAALKLYSEVLGYTGKVEIDNSTNKTTINEMKILLVKAEERKLVVEKVPNVKSEILNDKTPSPISLKLVKA